MIFEQHYLECLSQASYFIADETTRSAVVVDPRRDIQVYLDAADEHGVSIDLVLETHFHADFLSGHLELAAATEATIAYGPGALAEYEIRGLVDGERITIGDVALEILHTPGHTPESISVLVYQHAADLEPYAVLTGDTMFIGDVGRPDLLAANGVTPEEQAAELYDSVHTKLLALPDETLVFPGHGAGSACGKNLSTERWSTIGEQRVTNHALAEMSRTDFMAEIARGQPAVPRYFAFDAALNRQQRTLLDEASVVEPLTPSEVADRQAAGAVVLDCRDAEPFAAGHLPARSTSQSLPGSPNSPARSSRRTRQSSW